MYDEIRETPQHDYVTMGQYIAALLRERDRAYAQKFITLEQSIDHNNQSCKDAITMAERASNKAEIAAEHRFEQHNQFREQLREQTETFIRKDEANLRFATLEDMSTKSTAAINLNAGRQIGSGTVWYAVAMLAAFGVTFVSLLYVVFSHFRP